MSDDFSPYYAGLIVDHLSQAVDMPTAPTTLEVVLYDDTGSELSSELSGGRVSTSTGSGWTTDGTEFSNANELDFGEALSQITLQEFGLIDGSGNELIRGDVNGAPLDFPQGARVFAPAGRLSTDILD